MSDSAIAACGVPPETSVAPPIVMSTVSSAPTVDGDVAELRELVDQHVALVEQVVRLVAGDLVGGDRRR